MSLLELLSGPATTFLLSAGLTVPTVGCNALATGGPLIDKIVTVSEAWISIAILRLEKEKNTNTV